MADPRDRRSPFSDDDRTPPVRPPSAATALAWSEDCDADAERLHRIEVDARELAREFRALAETFRAWELATPDPELRTRAYARLLDMRERMRSIGK